MEVILFLEAQITLGAHAKRGYGSAVCLHLTSRMFVRLTNDTTYILNGQ